MKLRDIEPPSRNERENKHRFRIIGELGRKWDRAKHSREFDDIIRLFNDKYRVKATYRMSGTAFHGILYDKPIEVIIDLSRELDRASRF